MITLREVGVGASIMCTLCNALYVDCKSFKENVYFYSFQRIYIKSLFILYLSINSSYSTCVHVRGKNQNGKRASEEILRRVFADS